MNDDNKPPVDEQEQIARRRAKLGELRESGPAFPNDFHRDAFAADLHHQFAHTNAQTLGTENHVVSVAGRLSHPANSRQGELC